MKKKILLSENTRLFERVNTAEDEIRKLKGELDKCRTEINELTEENIKLYARLNMTEPLKKLESKVIGQACVSPEIDYGSKIIGEIVIEAAKACNSLTVSGSQDGTKELVNLILGRTEVAKSEILNIVTASSELEAKKQQIDAQYSSALDYFESVKAQIQ